MPTLPEDREIMKKTQKSPGAIAKPRAKSLPCESTLRSWRLPGVKRDGRW